jgi:hypothetical protein
MEGLSVCLARDPPVHTDKGLLPGLGWRRSAVGSGRLGQRLAVGPVLHDLFEMARTAI